MWMQEFRTSFYHHYLEMIVLLQMKISLFPCPTTAKKEWKFYVHVVKGNLSSISSVMLTTQQMQVYEKEPLIWDLSHPSVNAWELLLTTCCHYFQPISGILHSKEVATQWRFYNLVILARQILMKNWFSTIEQSSALPHYLWKIRPGTGHWCFSLLSLWNTIDFCWWATNASNPLRSSSVGLKYALAAHRWKQA